jgi:peptidoglycan hydrolase-like protein with peptidoglycan-binding domain
VPLSPETAEQISKADTAAGVQRQLLKLGYDAGPVGAVQGSKFKAAIEQAERSMGFPVTGEPTCGLAVTLRMQRTLN